MKIVQVTDKEGNVLVSIEEYNTTEIKGIVQEGLIITVDGEELDADS
ncbi:MAG: hypothetical protein KBT03_07630 [Bacteroidales bacterium]|nr:hypothetical protein [Candidatus Scybalousia scybalohippi]